MKMYRCDLKTSFFDNYGKLCWKKLFSLGPFEKQSHHTIVITLFMIGPWEKKYHEALYNTNSLNWKKPNVRHYQFYDPKWPQMTSLTFKLKSDIYHFISGKISAVKWTPNCQFWKKSLKKTKWNMFQNGIATLMMIRFWITKPFKIIYLHIQKTNQFMLGRNPSRSQ